MTETTERFFQEIAARIGYERVVEVHLFPVIRQGGVEGAVAVVAAVPERPPEPAASPESEALAAESVHESAADATAADVAREAMHEAGGEIPDETPDETPDASDDIAEEARHAPAEPARHVVYTARYRHTVKGTERGKWSVDVVAEADAPLVTVEAVVRGVVERSGEAFQPERITGEQFRAIVPAPAAPAPGPA